MNKKYKGILYLKWEKYMEKQCMHDFMNAYLTIWMYEFCDSKHVCNSYLMDIYC